VSRSNEDQLNFFMATQFSMFITLIITSSTRHDSKSLKVK